MLDKRDIFVNAFLLTLGSLFVLFLSFLVINVFSHLSKLDEACQNIDMKKAISFQSQRACLDYNGEAHLVDMTCTGLFVETCQAEIFSIGDYRIGS